MALFYSEICFFLNLLIIFGYLAESSNVFYPRTPVQDEKKEITCENLNVNNNRKSSRGLLEGRVVAMCGEAGERVKPVAQNVLSRSGREAMGRGREHLTGRERERRFKVGDSRR